MLAAGAMNAWLKRGANVPPPLTMQAKRFETTSLLNGDDRQCRQYTIIVEYSLFHRCEIGFVGEDAFPASSERIIVDIEQCHGQS